MNTSLAAQQFLIDIFWSFSSQVHEFKESERLQQIKTGVSTELVDAMRATFDLSDAHLAILLNESRSTLKRLKVQQKDWIRSHPNGSTGLLSLANTH